MSSMKSSLNALHLLIHAPLYKWWLFLSVFWVVSFFLLALKHHSSSSSSLYCLSSSFIHQGSRISCFFTTDCSWFFSLVYVHVFSLFRWKILKLCCMLESFEEPQNFLFFAWALLISVKSEVLAVELKSQYFFFNFPRDSNKQASLKIRGFDHFYELHICSTPQKLLSGFTVIGNKEQQKPSLFPSHFF